MPREVAHRHTTQTIMGDWEPGMMGDDPLDLSGVPMMGLHGVSKSAKDRKKNGLVYFNHFLEEVAQSKEATPKKWEDMAEAEICRVELFQAFGEFMKNRPNTGRGEPLSKAKWSRGPPWRGASKNESWAHLAPSKRHPRPPRLAETSPIP
jgi:hypothetical protein